MKRGLFQQILAIVGLWVVVAGIAARAQADTPAFTDVQIKAAAVEQANEYSDAYMHGDYDSLAIKTSQTIMDIQGGSQVMSMTIENKKSELSGQGIATNSIAIVRGKDRQIRLHALCGFTEQNLAHRSQGHGDAAKLSAGHVRRRRPHLEIH